MPAQLSFVIDCSKPVEDKIMDISSFEKFLQDRIKVEGKTGTWNTPLEDGALPDERFGLQVLPLLHRMRCSRVAWRHTPCAAPSTCRLWNSRQLVRARVYIMDAMQVCSETPSRSRARRRE